MANSELDDFLGEVKEEPKDPFAPEVKDPLDSVIEKKEEEIEVKPLPFHKDPKVQKYIEKEINKRLPKTETERFVKETTTGEEADEILSSLTEIVGNDTPQKIAAVSRLRKALAGSEERATKKAIAELQTISEQESQANAEADIAAEDELQEGFENIESTFGVDLAGNKKLREDFVDFIVRVAPKDSNGEVTEYPDFEETFKLFRDTRTPTNSKAKELSSRSMARSSDASATQQTGDNSWKAVDKLFSKIKE